MLAAGEQLPAHPHDARMGAHQHPGGKAADVARYTAHESGRARWDSTSRTLPPARRGDSTKSRYFQHQMGVGRPLQDDRPRRAKSCATPRSTTTTPRILVERTPTRDNDPLRTRPACALCPRKRIPWPRSMLTAHDESLSIDVADAVAVVEHSGMALIRFVAPSGPWPCRAPHPSWQQAPRPARRNFTSCSPRSPMPETPLLRPWIAPRDTALGLL